MHPDFVILGRLVVAALLAAVLGWEREQAGKSAGLRTHMLVGIAAALYTALGEVASTELGAGRSDPVRAIQAVAMGIGFLGGGMIFVNRSTDRVQGLFGPLAQVCQLARGRVDIDLVLCRSLSPMLGNARHGADVNERP